jgi:succinate-semialdehyde dehydrogenase/glutarate-semialdehyde dehydrogenase
MPIQSINPATGELLRSFRPLEPEAVAAKIALAHETSRSYPSETLAQRMFWMRRLAHLLEADESELATLMVMEMGKTITSARAEVAKCARACRYYAEQSEGMLVPEFIATEHERSYVRWDPLGVVLAVMPWNFPLWQVFRFLVPALMAGNVGLLKHASNVPQCALAIEALVRRAGFPRGVFQTLLIESKQVEKVLGDERIAAVTLTGSEAAGRAVAAQAGYLIKKSVLELGGSDPFIVMPSADLTDAVKNAVEARCINNGQSCIAAKRFIIHEAIYREFEQRFVEGMAAQIVGDPMNESTQIGPLATAQVAEDLQRQVDAAIHEGGRLLTGGRRLTREGNFFSPTVISGLPRTAAVTREETFGPLAFVFKVNSLDEAIVVANDTPFGLGASCWTNEVAEQQRLALELQCGSVFFNAPVASDPRLPFGGIKRSGYGRELSAAGMREFLNAKTVVVAKTAVQPPSVENATEPRAVLPMREQPLVTAKAESEKARRSRGTATLGLTEPSE